jgi:uncharacterized OB-fold protein
VNAPAAQRPHPVLTRDNEFFWHGIQKEQLLVQQCTQCGEVRHPPMPACPYCQSLSWEPVELSGRGTVYSFTTIHRPLPPGIAAPARVALVELDRGVRMVAGFRSPEDRNPQIGEPVAVTYERVDDDLTIPWFEPQTGASA